MLRVTANLEIFFETANPKREAPSSFALKHALKYLLLAHSRWSNTFL